MPSLYPDYLAPPPSLPEMAPWTVDKLRDALGDAKLADAIGGTGKLTVVAAEIELRVENRRNYRSPFPFSNASHPVHDYYRDAKQKARDLRADIKRIVRHFENEVGRRSTGYDELLAALDRKFPELPLDNGGRPAVNVDRCESRAEIVRDALQAAGVNLSRRHFRPVVQAVVARMMEEYEPEKGKKGGMPRKVSMALKDFFDRHQ